MLVNGSPKGFFRSKRGLKLGDPLSPSLFLMVGEDLSSMLFLALQVGLVRGFKVAQNASVINHLQFLDDTLIFCPAKLEHLMNVKAILLCLEVVSFLKINFFKSELIGIKVDEYTLSSIAEILGCGVGSFPVWYLGLPLCIRRHPKNIWDPVVERMER